MAQAPQPSLGDQVKAERVVVEKLIAEFQYTEAWKRAEALVPATVPPFDKKDNQTLVRSCSDYLDYSKAHNLALEAADTAGAWEKALEHAKAAKALATEAYTSIKEPFERTVAYYQQTGARTKQVLVDNDARIKELKAKTTRDAGEQQELDLAIGVEKEVADDAKWVNFFQTYLDVAKRESVSFDSLIKLLEEKIQNEAKQVDDYKAGKGDKLKWVEAVISTPAYLEAQGDKAGLARWLYRLSNLDPANLKVQRQLDILHGLTPAPLPKPKKGKKG
ncbi:MAG TPA: hypothetical protein VJ486_07655 [Geothrix sp.]|nr:hypothetical protein [Geothrix sp.]